MLRRLRGFAASPVAVAISCIIWLWFGFYFQSSSEDGDRFALSARFGALLPVIALLGSLSAGARRRVGALLAGPPLLCALGLIVSIADFAIPTLDSPLLACALLVFCVPLAALQTMTALVPLWDQQGRRAPLLIAGIALILALPVADTARFWSSPAGRLSSAIEEASVGDWIRFSDFTAGDWDRMHAFSGPRPWEEIDEALGFHWDAPVERRRLSHGEGHHLFVFVRRSEVVDSWAISRSLIEFCPKLARLARARGEDAFTVGRGSDGRPCLNQ